MPRTKKPRNRVWQPRPSQKAQDRILAAVRELINRDDWTMGFTVSLQAMADLLQNDPPETRLTYSTVAFYMSWMDANGTLKRVSHGVYELPANRG